MSLPATAQQTSELSCFDTTWCFDPDVYILYGPDHEYPLPPKHGQLLKFLIENQHRFVSLEDIHNQVWSNRIVSDAAVRKVIVDLKKFLRTGEEVDIIENRRAVGYRLRIPFAMKCTTQAPALAVVDTSRPVDAAKMDCQLARTLLKEQRSLLAEHMKTLQILEDYLYSECQPDA